MAQILVIEDEQDIRSQLVKILDYEGFEVLEAEDGRKGINLAKSQLPELIICDISMPEIDGYDVLRELRRLPSTVAIPFIFLTARAGHQDFRKGMQSGADDYLTKPFDIDELLTVIHTRLQKRISIQEQASQHMKSLCQNLSGSLPHEMRTPLNSIIGFTRFLVHLGADRLPPPEEIINVLQDILGDAIRLEHLVENFLLCAQLLMMEYDENCSTSYGKDIGPCLPQPIIQQAACDKAKAYHREQDLCLELTNDQAVLSCTILQKVCLELADNAFKFSEPGTLVKVSGFFEQTSFILQVEDQGRGMSSEQVQQIGAFRQFERKKYEQQGSGLGLSIVQLLARHHQAKLSLHSAPGQGTTVILNFQEAHPESAGQHHG